MCHLLLRPHSLDRYFYHDVSSLKLSEYSCGSEGNFQKLSADSSESLDVQTSKPSIRPMVRAGPSLSIAGFILNEIKFGISSIMWTGPSKAESLY